MSLPQPHSSLFQYEAIFRKMLKKNSYISPYLLALLNSFKERMSCHRTQPHYQYDAIFREIFPKRSYLSPYYLVLLNSFEDKLARSFKKLMETSMDNVLSLSWMKLAMESLRETRDDIPRLFVDLGVCRADLYEYDAWCWSKAHWDTIYSLQDLCEDFIFEISRLREVSRALEYALQIPNPDDADFSLVQISIYEWEHPSRLHNLVLENCSAIMESINTSLKLPSIKNPTKGKILMRALYGFKVKTLLISSIFTSAFSNSPKKLVQLHVPKKLPWSDAFKKSQLQLYEKIRSQCSNQRDTTALKELQDIINLLNRDEESPVIPEATLSFIKKAAENFSDALDLLSTEMNYFNKTVLDGLRRRI